ncbi:hypothetical protein ACFSO7_02180 [Bacillus sp. CGMCC 1.16607]|uniref:hypothetical protein n=1 Tax=Bacillus sp. CGMCC 1.16607 TaxID=3351842 RepID=UPI003636F5D5
MKRSERIKMRNKYNKPNILAVFTIVGAMTIMTYNISFAQLDLGERLDQLYSNEKNESFNALDSLVEQELALKNDWLKSEVEWNVKKLEPELTNFTAGQTEQYRQSLQNHYQQLSSQIFLSAEKEKEDYRLQLETQLEAAKLNIEQENLRRQQQLEELEEKKEREKLKVHEEKKDIPAQKTRETVVQEPEKTEQPHNADGTHTEREKELPPIENEKEEEITPKPEEQTKEQTNGEFVNVKTPDEESTKPEVNKK